MSSITQLPIWHDLIEHKKAMNSARIDKLCENEPARLSGFTFKIEDLFFDFSKNLISSQTKKLLIDLAVACELKNKIQDLFRGEKVNFTEKKAALHMACRIPDNDVNFLAQSNILSDVLDERQKMYRFVDQVRQGKIKGHTGRAFKDVVSIGVGGSSLGPQMIFHALKKYQSLFNIYFISGMDGEEINSLMEKINPETTLFIVVSKSFKTVDTITNAKIAKEWLINNKIDYKYHMVGVSDDENSVIEFGIFKDYFFKIEEYIGGRYSVWTAASLAVILAVGKKIFNEFLTGAFLIDQHFMFTDFAQNVPVLLGLIDIWYINFLNIHDHIILPYSSSFRLFPSFLQQLEMESCGKQVTRSKQIVDYATGPFVWGEVGFLGQHSFYQLLHQGTQKFFIDLILPLHPSYSKDENPENIVICNALAQIQALIEGNNNTSELYLQNRGNNPINIIILPEITPKTLGMLIALYEHKVFTKSVVWNINPFDQYGVEWGKQLARYYENAFLNLNTLSHPSRSPNFMRNIIDYITTTISLR